MDTVAISNLSASPIGVRFFSVLAAGASKTKTLKTVEADDDIAGYDRLAVLGGLVSVNGTLRAGAQSVTVATTLANTTRAVTVNTTSGAYSLTLMPLAQVPLNGILYIKLATFVNNLTIDANAAETIDGLATLVMSAAGTVRLKKTGATTWVTV